MRKRQIILGVGIAGLVVLMTMWLALRPSPSLNQIPWPDGGRRLVSDWDAAVADNGIIQRPVRAISTLTGTIVDPLTLATGVSGTYTVPRGYVVGFSAVADGNAEAGGVDGGIGGYATIVITPNGPSVTDSALVTQPPILIPAGLNYSAGRPVIQGATNELGAGTVFVFTGTISYTIVMSLGGT